VRRAVWTRDAGRCAFIGTQGRCAETGCLEFHHVKPYADGGPATVDNIELRCRAHNAYEAELFFGGDVSREGSAGYLNSVRTEWFPSGSRICHNRSTPGWRNWQTLGT
jgi:HNH endonuclease